MIHASGWVLRPCTGLTESDEVLRKSSVLAFESVTLIRKMVQSFSEDNMSAKKVVDESRSSGAVMDQRLRPVVSKSEARKRKMAASLVMELHPRREPG
jgi:hypothetical protein